MRAWRVRPKADGRGWLVFSPGGERTEFVTGGLAIEYGRQRAQDAHEILLVYDSEGREIKEAFRLH